MKHPGHKARVILDQECRHQPLLSTHLSGGPHKTEKIFSPFLSYDMNDPTCDVAALTIELDCRFLQLHSERISLRWLVAQLTSDTSEPD